MILNIIIMKVKKYIMYNFKFDYSRKVFFMVPRDLFSAKELFLLFVIFLYYFIFLLEK